MLILFFNIIFLFINFAASQTQDKGAKFAEFTEVNLFKDQDFDNKTRLGSEIPSKPYFIFFFSKWCIACKRIIPIWEKIEKQYRDTIIVGAVSCDRNTEISDRFLINKYPTMIYFSTNNRMYYFEDDVSEKNLQLFLDNDLWKIQQSYQIPTEISYTRVYIQKLTSPLMIPILIVLTFFVIITIVCIKDQKYQKQVIAEAKQIKQDFKDKELIKETEEDSQQIKVQIQKQSSAELYESTIAYNSPQKYFSTFKDRIEQNFEMELSVL